jgi:CDP-diacylglycerol--glycerol-3-phosphate 3-phosphatidyltransferase
VNPAIVLTSLRLLFAPLFAWTFVTGYGGRPNLAWLWAAVAVAALSEFTDAIDGVVARRRGQVTDFGKVLDPSADSLARLTAFISFMVCGIIPLWMFLVFMYRDLLMGLLRVVCASRGTVLAARKSGKLKAVIQALAIFGVLGVCLLDGYGVAGARVWVLGFHLGFWVVALPALVTALSLLDYVIPNWHAIMAMAEPVANNPRP